MKLTKEELIELYQPRSETAERPEDCPTAEELALASTEDMSPQERERVAAHLTVCRDCAEEYRLVLPLKDMAEKATGTRIYTTKTEDARPAWRRLGMRLSSASLPYAVAALMLIVSLALGAWIVSLRRDDRSTIARLEKAVAERDEAVASAAEALEEARRQLQETVRHYEQEKTPQNPGQAEAEIAELRRAVDELSRPQLNIPIVNLEPQGSVRGQPSARAALIEVPPSANVFTLVLNVAGQQAHSSYALEVADQSGKVVWQGRGLRRTPYNTFTVAFARRLLPAGQYHIRVYAVSGGKRELVEDYWVQVRYE